MVNLELSDFVSGDNKWLFQHRLKLFPAAIQCEPNLTLSKSGTLKFSQYAIDVIFYLIVAWQKQCCTQ